MLYRIALRIMALLLLFFTKDLAGQSNIVVFQSDFGIKDGAVAAMKGVALGVSRQLQLYDLTHEIPAYNTWEAGYRLYQAAEYWPAGTVFVSVVDPGVGTERKSVVLKTRSGHYFVGPDNGQFTLVAEKLGIDSVLQIDEAVNRRQNSGASYTFHGRDVYAYTAARLASGSITLMQVGPAIPAGIQQFTYQRAAWNGRAIEGNIPILDTQYGNVWTNIDTALLKKAGIRHGDTLHVRIMHKEQTVANVTLPYVATFGDVPEGHNLAYLNSLLQLSFAINMGNFAEKYKTNSGAEWSVAVAKKKRLD